MIRKIEFPAIGNRKFTVFGGPYRERPALTTGVKLAVELKLPADIHVPTRDFDVPNEGVLIKGLWQAINCMSYGECLYVGCMGGLGRTGLFLAALAKAWGIKDPIKYVRTYYNPRAVETPDQERYIRDLHIPAKMTMRVWGARMGALLRKNPTTIPANVLDTYEKDQNFGDPYGKCSYR